MTGFSDYIIYVDETGDHSLTSIDKQYPMFGLSFCIFKKSDYTDKVVPLIQALKFKYWGHDAVVLHEHEIRKTTKDFAFLRTDPDLRASFMQDLSGLIEEAPFSVIACVIDKNKHIEKYENPWNPYEVALKMGLERVLLFLRENCTTGRKVHIVFECRGREEDRQLEVEFKQIVSSGNKWGWVNRCFADFEWEARFAKKAVNSAGLQLADLTARPITLSVLRPEQDNRAYQLIEPKMKYLKVFP